MLPILKHPGSEYGVTLPPEERLNELGNDRRIILMVGMDHDHDVAAELEGFRVAGLLVPSVPAIFLVGEDPEAELPGEIDGAVRARVVDEEDVIHPVARDVVERAFQGFLGVVGGHDDDDFFQAFHDLFAADSYSTFRAPGERRLLPGRFSRHDAHENPAASSALKTPFAVDLSGPDPGKPALP